jgi:DNA-binding NarL/FixJ family response regulator
MSRWCEAEPEITGFRSACLVHRAEMLQLQGDWVHALEEARIACSRVERITGAAYYQLGELLRLQGEYDESEAAFRDASERGHNPEPGLSLLRLARGRLDAAVRAMRRAAGEARDARTRGRLLGPFVEVLLAAGDVETATPAARELLSLAEDFDSPWLHAAGNQAMGAVLLANREARSALEALRESAERWREVGAPYEGARTTVLISRAFHLLGDSEAAEMELATARRCFERLGARHDLAATRADGESSGRLTGREVEVVRLIATGCTNRAIAGRLGISEKTVARHISNIFTKLGLSSRAAATAYAYQHHLAGPTT